MACFIYRVKPDHRTSRRTLKIRREIEELVDSLARPAVMRGASPITMPNDKPCF